MWTINIHRCVSQRVFVSRCSHIEYGVTRRMHRGDVTLEDRKNKFRRLCKPKTTRERQKREETRFSEFFCGKIDSSRVFSRTFDVSSVFKLKRIIDYDPLSDQ